MIGAIKAFFSAIGEFFGWKRQDQLIEAGENKERLNHNKDVQDETDEINRDSNDPDILDRLRQERRD